MPQAFPLLYAVLLCVILLNVLISVQESGRVAYLGRRRRTKDDIQLQMYRTLLQVSQ